MRHESSIGLLAASQRVDRAKSPIEGELPVVLVAHGSRDPRAQATTRALARAVAAARPGLDVRVSFLELAQPSPAEVLEVTGGPAVVVPLLLTPAYHGSVDLPAQVAGYDCVLTDPVGGVSDLMLTALTKRLAEVSTQYDHLVLVAAGTRVPEGRAVVAQVAAALGERLGVRCREAYATGAPQPELVVDRNTAVASYFLAPGRLYDLAVRSALAGGATAVAAPLGSIWELAQMVLQRVDAKQLVAV